MTVDLYQSLLPYGIAYNEASADGVTPRLHWAGLIESLREIGPEELERRWGRAERRIRENGITYNIYSDPLGANRPWKIDVVPFLIAADEWRLIEAGIIQRARLLSLILEDLYGSQSLVANGHFPPDSFMPIQLFFARWWECASPRTVICICWRLIWLARRTDNGGFFPIERKLPQAAAMPSRTAPSSQVFCPISSETRTCCASLPFSVPSAKFLPPWPSAAIRASCS